MATYSPSLSNQRHGIPTYLQEQKLSSYPESLHIPGNIMYLNEPFTAEYLSLDLAGGIDNTFKVERRNNPQCSMSPKNMHSGSNLNESSGLGSTIVTSEYLKAAEELLDEVVNVRSALKQHKSCQNQNFRILGLKEVPVKSDTSSMCPLSNLMPFDSHESTTNSSCEPSPAERQDLQNKLTKLFSMMDEVDRRYKQYYHQMQTMISSFEMIVGCGAAKPYTDLALQTISRHFRNLRDAINGQIQVTSQRLGEQYAKPSGLGGGLSRLRYMDPELRQRSGILQLGIMRHSWRPQRGLPESSVSVLRAWMFEHFLHPYPKESEKIMLAKQTGLTRSQVANWFINARVRLWKPMIEEMYKDEFGDFETRGEELLGSVSSTAAYGGHSGKFKDSNSDSTPNAEMNVNDNSLFPDEVTPTNQSGDGSLRASSAEYVISELGSFGIGNGETLALQLRHCEEDAFSASGWTQLKQDMERDTADYHSIDPVNQPQRFGNPHLLPDFVS